MIARVTIIATITLMSGCSKQVSQPPSADSGESAKGRDALTTENPTADLRLPPAEIGPIDSLDSEEEFPSPSNATNDARSPGSPKPWLSTTKKETRKSIAIAPAPRLELLVSLAEAKDVLNWMAEHVTSGVSPEKIDSIMTYLKSDSSQELSTDFKTEYSGRSDPVSVSFRPGNPIRLSFFDGDNSSQDDDLISALGKKFGRP